MPATLGIKKTEYPLSKDEISKFFKNVHFKPEHIQCRLNNDFWILYF